MLCDEIMGTDETSEARGAALNRLEDRVSKALRLGAEVNRRVMLMLGLMTSSELLIQAALDVSVSELDVDVIDIALSGDMSEKELSRDLHPANILFDDAVHVERLCSALEYHGLASVSNTKHHELGIALIARAFVALRSNTGLVFGSSLIRALAVNRLGATALCEGLKLLRTQQKIDGSFGLFSIPMSDLSLRFDLPASFSIMQTYHDVLSKKTLLKKVQSNRKERDVLLRKQASHGTEFAAEARLGNA